MKVYRCLLCLVIALFSILHCNCQGSEELLQLNKVHNSRMDRFQPSLGNPNGLLTPLERSGSANLDRPGTGSTEYTDVPTSNKTAETIANRLGYVWLNNDIKRSWSKMNAAWGKRNHHGVRNEGWSKFGGAWGKREPGWNNLKGLWGKRADQMLSLSGGRGRESRVY